MEQLSFSILLVLAGLFVGVISVIVINRIKENNTSKKVDEILTNAQKEAEKIKKDYLAEAKEELNIIKQDNEKEIKEKKEELKAAEERLITRENNIDRRVNKKRHFSKRKVSL